jgi:hypothetical protein
MSTATSMAEGTASVELAGGADKVTAARLKALEPGAYGGAEWRAICGRMQEAHLCSAVTGDFQLLRSRHENVVGKGSAEKALLVGC